MPAVQYPFIDIAVHERVRERFGRGEAMALFSMDLQSPLWANGRGAALFGTPVIYDFLERGPQQQDVTFRQFAAATARLTKTGNRQQFSVRIHSGFQSLSVIASAEIIEVEAGQPVVLFSVPMDQNTPSLRERASRMIAGFDDPDIHMAVIDADNRTISSSSGFSALGITPHTMRTLITMASNQSGKLVKRPVPTGKGYLPAAVGQLSTDPELNLLFVVETVIGTLDPSNDFAPAQESAPQLAALPIESMDAPSDPTPQIIEALDADIGIEDEAGTDESVAFVDNDEAEQETATVTSHETDDVTDEPASDDEQEPEYAVSTPETPVVAVQIEEPNNAQSTPGIEQPFNFNRNGRASRFVWKIDAAGRFSSISHEFADAVGPNAAAVEGMSFADLAALFNFDPDGKIIELLNKRDTWSGKTIYWPVQGTSLIVPIDLAALPTYTRAREFDGFRGFGIVRLTGAIDDPHAVGMSLDPAPEPTADQPEQILAAPETDEEQTLFSLAEHAVGESGGAGRDADDENDTPAEPAQNYAPPAHEVPALTITETPNRRYSDKVVRFEERSSKTRDGLTPHEEAAFREIGRTLSTPASTEEPEDRIEQEISADVSAIETGTEAVTPIDNGAHETNVTIDEEDAFADYTRGDEPVVFMPLPTDHRTPADDEFEADVAASEVVRTASSLTADIVDQMPIALLIHSGDTLIHANPEFLRLTGYDDIDALSDVGGLDALLQRDELNAVSEQSGGMVAVSADNDLIPVKARLQSVRWDGTNVLMLSLIPVSERNTEPSSAQITDGVAAPDTTVESLTGEVEELRSILETATDGVVLLGEDGQIRSLNRSASALFNYDNGEIAAKPFVTLFAHESQRAVLDYLSGLANNGVASVLNDGREVIGREASGGFLPLFMTIGRLKSSNGYCAVIRDITQWKRTEEDLRNAKRAAETANAHKTDFLARVSHEIRTPLNAIIGFADMMATERFGPVGSARYIEYSNDIVRSGRHVLDIVNDLLDISKIEAGQMDVDFKAVALNDTIAEAVSIVQPQANNQRVIIRTALSQSVPQIVADLRSIKQIMLNILSNAIKFTPSGGQIVVSTAYEPNGSVILRIRDTGMGMSRTELEQAMKPFRQVSASRSRVRGDGTGLGLPLTKAMVDANRANFSITSAPNEGTLVEISFPSQRVLAN